MTSPGPITWTASGNDYRGIERLEPGIVPKVRIILTGDPGSNGEALEALRTQDYAGPLEILAVGTSLESVGEWPVVTVDESTEADVVILLGHYDLPEPGWVERHVGWHRRVENVVVIGSRAGDESTASTVRRSRSLLSGDEPFVAMGYSNVSMRWEHWVRVFYDQPTSVVAGWRLWNDGLFFVPDPDAVVSTSADSDADEDEKDARLIEDLIPHSRFRLTPSALHTTPKVSWVVPVSDSETAERAWRTCQASLFPDQEVVFYGPSAGIASFQALKSDYGRVSIVSSDGPEAFSSAVAGSRGELLVILDPRTEVPEDVVTKAVARYEAKPSAQVVRAGYLIEGDRYLRFDDLTALDTELGAKGLPLFAVASRREVMKELQRGVDPGLAWDAVLARTSSALVISPLVKLTGTVSVRPRSVGLAELPTVSLEELARTVVSEWRRRRAATSSSEEQEPASDDDRVSVAYVGFTGHNNLGDEAVMAAIQRLMPWAALEREPVDPQLLMVGGGTLINGRRYYLTRLLRQESAVVERALFGTGVRSPEFWGVTEPMDDWFSFIDSALVAAVRGPDSVRNLRKLGYHRDLPIIGDPALSLRPPEDIVPVEGRIVVCPVYTSGNLHGGSDEAVFDALATFIGKMRAEGREVVMLTAFPQDDRWAIDIMDRAEARDMPYVAGYEDIDATMGLLASADLVVGERLHAIIMAAAAGTAFVGLEYRPKLRDFAKSVGQERAVIRTDEMHRLERLVSRVLEEREGMVEATASHVSDYRVKQDEAAAELHRLLMGR